MRIWWLAIIGIVIAVSVVLVIVSVLAGANFGKLESGHGEYDDWTEFVSGSPQSLAPQWSSDGSHIVFTKLNNPEAVWPDDDVYSVTSDGSQLRLVYEDARWPSISPDGTRIAYGTTRDGRLPFYIETAKLDGSDRRQLTELASNDATLNDVSPSLSPDGQSIAFARLTPGLTEGIVIYIMDADGSNLSQLFRFRTGMVGDAATDAYRWGPVWSPNGEKLAFVVQELQDHSIYEYVNRYVLYTLGADGSRLTRTFVGTLGKSVIPRGPAIDQILGLPTWSPDGQKLAFARYIRSDYKDFAAGEEIKVPPGIILNTINHDGSGLRTIAEFGEGRRMESLSWSPNGNDVLFTLSEVYTTLVGSRVYMPMPTPMTAVIARLRKARTHHGLPTVPR